MGVLLFQNETLKDSWQLEVVYKTLKNILKKYDWIIVHRNYKEFKNVLVSKYGSNDKDGWRKWDSIFNNETRIIEISKEDLPNENFERCVALFTNPYMHLFDKEILSLKENKINIKRLIKATYELFNNVISKELDIEEELLKPKKESIFTRIFNKFK